MTIKLENDFVSVTFRLIIDENVVSSNQLTKTKNNSLVKATVKKQTEYKECTYTIKINIPK